MLSLWEAVLLEERRREKVRVRMLSTCESHFPASVESQMRNLTESSPMIAYGSCRKCHLHLNPRGNVESGANRPTRISCLYSSTKEASLLPGVPQQTADHTRIVQYMQIRFSKTAWNIFYTNQNTIRNTISCKFAKQTFLGHIRFLGFFRLHDQDTRILQILFNYYFIMCINTKVFSIFLY